MNAVWDEISEDNAAPYQPDLINECWVGLFADEYVGMYRLHQLTSVMWQGHVFMLPDKREFSLEGGEAIKKWALENLTGMEKMIVEVPECFRNVIRFVEKIGFKKQGYNSNAYMKGKLRGVHQLGMTSEEMK